ncbi:hypothetical protein GQ43DRAFT_383075 [Delitschia confertaspora ATCC 74209]|uniref:Carboxymethylenebutenolidase n=1 Tax=Delitschia confertaspora ATCC 74209 TaxID=1513339 RepID=A0A9P4JBP6_9PLEO|nr:hypothetical protein GQ43DRAFT_383075 [Delitschia confertaspora ATCC 74209]
MSTSGRGFTTFSSRPPRIFLTSPSPPPERTLLDLQSEGFETTYVPYPYPAGTPIQQQTDPTKAFTTTLKNLHNTLSFGEDFALIAYGAAASIALHVAQKPLPRLVALIAYYPTVLPSPKFKYPTLMRLAVHLAGDSSPVAKPETCEWKCYLYEGILAGFAEEGRVEFEGVEAGLAFSRTLSVVRSAFKHEPDLERVVEENWRGKYDIDVPEEGSRLAVQSMTNSSPHVTILPTLEGGIGRKNLDEFYREFFIPSLVDDFDIRLVSRTIGVDRVVDEMVVSFTHTDDVDWILPGVPPTDKFVEIPIVSVVAIRGGKLVSEHMYWDQASVLVQVGLLDPKMVPKRMKEDGLKRLPVTGAEAAQQLVEPRQQRYNGLLKEHGLMDALNGVNGS